MQAARSKKPRRPRIWENKKVNDLSVSGCVEWREERRQNDPELEVDGEISGTGCGVMDNGGLGRQRHKMQLVPSFDFLVLPLTWEGHPEESAAPSRSGYQSSFICQDCERLPQVMKM